MKNLTKLLIFCLMVTMSVNCYSQTFGIKGGVNFANMSVSASGMGVNLKSITTFHAGPVADFKLQDNLYFNTGLLFSLKGFKVEDATFEDVTGGTLHLNYLEVPLNLAYKFPIKEQTKFLIQAGPYLGYALSGKAKSGGESVSVNFSEDGIKRFDYGLGFGAGVEFGQIVTSINYQVGLANLNDDSTMDAKLKNKVFQISLAYMFGEAKKTPTPKK